jgi:hypothetical protein
MASRIGVQSNLPMPAPAVKDIVDPEADKPGVPTVYTRPVLRIGSENPSGKLGGNACCGNC